MDTLRWPQSDEWPCVDPLVYKRILFQGANRARGAQAKRVIGQSYHPKLVVFRRFSRLIVLAMLPQLQWLFWLSVATVVVITVGYPVLLVALGPILRRPWGIQAEEPRVSLIIAAHNEETCIARKLDNSLALGYPRERLEILVASDGSTDGTNAIVESYRAQGVVLCNYARMGKTGIQNETVRRAQGDIVVFSDANAMYRVDAVRKLVRNFADSEVACVCGQLVYEGKGAGAGDSESSYWSYEKFIKRRESEVSSLIGANGSIYAVRRADYVEVEPDLISDFVEPLALVARGKRVVYEPEAVSVEEASVSYGGEFRRKVRILTRSIKGLLHMRGLLNPFRYGIFSLQLLMHKLLRYLVPLFLVTGAASLLGLAVLGSYRTLFLFAVSATLLAVLVGRSSTVKPANLAVRICHLLYYYLMVNYALVLAWGNVIRGRGVTVWAPERRNEGVGQG